MADCEFWCTGGDPIGVVTDFLDRILVRRRIRMYVGSDTGTALFYFLAGFSEGAVYSGRLDQEYEAFKQWLQIRLGDKNWLRVGLTEKGMSETEAREFFFTLWDEFRASSRTS